jgi:hypothetical protein
VTASSSIPTPRDVVLSTTSDSNVAELIWYKFMCSKIIYRFMKLFQKVQYPQNKKKKNSTGESKKNNKPTNCTAGGTTITT